LAVAFARGGNDFIWKDADVCRQELFDLEGVVGVLEGVRGRTVDTVYDLFFTDKRMIAAVLNHPSDFNDIYGKPNLMSLVLGNFPQQRAVKMRSLDLIESRRAAFANKTVDEILALHMSNLEIDYENIIYVTVKKGFLTKSLEFAVKNPSGKKVRFSLEESQIAEAEELLKKALPEKAK
jgi:hypothetical protein